VLAELTEAITLLVEKELRGHGYELQYWAKLAHKYEDYMRAWPPLAANGWLLARRKGLCEPALPAFGGFGGRSMRVCIEWLVTCPPNPPKAGNAGLYRMAFGQHQANTRPTPGQPRSGGPLRNDIACMPVASLTTKYFVTL
jgi:hypothetical protein